MAAISGISTIGSDITPIQMPSVDGTSGTTGTGAASGGNFATSMGDALNSLQETQSKSDGLAMQMATGQLTDVHDYMIAANQAEIATQLTVAVRNKAVDAFNQIMNMQI